MFESMGIRSRSRLYLEGLICFCFFHLAASDIVAPGDWDLGWGFLKHIANQPVRLNFLLKRHVFSLFGWSLCSQIVENQPFRLKCLLTLAGIFSGPPLGFQRRP